MVDRARLEMVVRVEGWRQRERWRAMLLVGRPAMAPEGRVSASGMSRGRICVVYSI